MRVPTAEELAAIAAAYLARRPAPHSPPAIEGSRWALAARVYVDDASDARRLAQTTSRWAAAARSSR